MPSVRDKACHYSAQRQHTFQYAKLLRSANTSFIKWIYPPRRLDIFLKNRLGDRETDMPKAGEEKAFNRNKKPSSEVAKNNTSENSVRKPASSPPRPSRDAEESGQDRRGSPASSERGPQPIQIANECTKILNVPLPVGHRRQAADTTNGKRTASSAAYLDYQLNQELRRRKKQIVDTLMAAILECLDKKLEALEEGCDGSSPSHPSSSGFRTGNQKSQFAGKKRHLHRDDQDDNDNDEDNGGRENRNNKRAKIVPDVNRLKYACPYYKKDPERFKSHRTCCGPGWTEVHRVKEHLNRAHSLPKHQCNRCYGRFKEEEDLKAHQREATPCSVKDQATIHRDLADGFDQEQQQKLAKRTKKTSEDKWKEWYCILFNLKPDSADIPSPYHDIPSGLRQGSNSSNGESFQNFHEYYRDRITPLIHHAVESEVEKAMLDVEDKVKLNVLDRMKSIPALLHRLLQSIPPPSGDVEGEYSGMTAPDNFNPDDVFANLSFDEADGFDFGGINESPVFLEPSDTSGSSSFSESCHPNPGSDTSVDEENSYQGFDLKPTEIVAQQVPGLSDPYPVSGYY